MGGREGNRHDARKRALTYRETQEERWQRGGEGRLSPNRASLRKNMKGRRGRRGVLVRRFFLRREIDDGGEKKGLSRAKGFRRSEKKRQRDNARDTEVGGEKPRRGREKWMVRRECAIL